jgi:hypothetical protein
VVRRDRHHPQRREMPSTFEPRRLRLAWLVQAYEQVVPLVRRTLSRPAGHQGEDAEELRRSSPQGPSPCVGESPHYGERLPALSASSRKDQMPGLRPPPDCPAHK